MTTFTNIYKNELKSKGILSSLGSTALKRTRERLDPRNMLFGGSGMIAATGQKIFGKGYSAIQSGSGSKLSTKTAEVSGLQSEAVSSLLTSSLKQESQLAIIAKNTMNNNAMARDMNVMRQNVMKLVTMGGGKASRGADMFFKDAKARESEYESKFKKGAPTTAPTPVKQEKEKSSGILGMLATLAGPLLGVGKLIVSTITSALSGLGEIVLKGLSAIFSVDALRAAFGITSSIFSGLSKLLPLVMNPAFLGIITAIAGAAWLAKWISDKNDEANTEEKKNLRVAEDRGSNSQKLAARTFLINDDLKSFLKDDRTDADVSELTRGEITTKADLAKAISSAESAGKRVIEIKDSQVVSDMQRKLSNQTQEASTPQSTTPTAAPYNSARDSQSANTPTPANTNSDGAFKSKEDFIRTMYPLAIKAAEALGGIDPNALLTQWGFESAWGKKVSGKYNYFGIKADPSWKGEKSDVMTHEFVAGEKVKIPQPFRSYTSPEEAVDDYVKFLKTNKRYEKAGVFKSKTSGEFFSALQTAGYATDPNYASKLTNATAGTAKQVAGIMGTPSMTGPALASASTASSDLNRASNTQQPPIVNVNAPQTTNVAGGKGGEQQVASATNIDALDLFFKFAM